MKLINIYNFALVLSLFPWISFGIIDGGIQPFFIFARYLISKKISKEYLLLFLPILFILFNSFSGEIARFDFIREVVAYFSMAMSFIFFKQYLQLFGFPSKIILYAITISIAAGIVQVLFDEKIFELVVHARTTSGRGVTGFSSEPGYYGMHIALLASLLLLSSREGLLRPLYFRYLVWCCQHRLWLFIFI